MKVPLVEPRSLTTISSPLEDSSQWWLETLGSGRQNWLSSKRPSVPFSGFTSKTRSVKPAVMQTSFGIGEVVTLFSGW